MRKLLIIYPNWLPSNAVGVQRIRLIVNYIQKYGWDPIILTVKTEYYEEEISFDLINTVKANIKVVYVDAKKPNPTFRIYGDIALRAFSNLKKEAIKIIKEDNIDFIWTPIPPFYTALIARAVHNATGKPYAIDYIDPWVHDFPGSKRLFSRGWLASILAKILEPIALKKVSAITGVSEPYFLPVIQRNPNLKNVPYCGMPYGFDKNDYSVKPANLNLLWDRNADVIPFVYAGAFLPKAHYYIDILFKVIAELRRRGRLQYNVRLYFVGTGSSGLSSVHDYALKYGIEDIVTEIKQRISYLEVLNNLSNSAGVLAIGSTEPHYTASKIFQSVLSTKPVFAIFHHLSTVVEILRNANADNYLVQYNELQDEEAFAHQVAIIFEEFVNCRKGWNPQLDVLDQYSAEKSAKALAKLLDSKFD